MPRIILAAVSLLLVLRSQGTERLAGTLVDGAVLEYVSGTQSQPAWLLDSVRFNVAHGGRTGCSRLFFGKRADVPQPYDRVACVEQGVLYEWSGRESAFAAQRPVLPNQRLVIQRPNRDSIVVTTGALETDAVGEHRLPVLPTMMLTYDSLGRARRRLRERYALGLATATSGIFERPDASATDGWTVTQEFKLAALRLK